MFKKEVYRYKGLTYLTRAEVQVKNDITRNWETHILYQNRKGELFCRETKEFKERFTLLVDQTEVIDVLLLFESWVIPEAFQVPKQ